MSYLDTLSRMTDSPIVDYHLCLFKNPHLREEVYDFFSAPKVSETTQQINSLETQLYQFDKKQRSIGNQPNLRDEAEERTLIYQRWKSRTADYKYLWKKFQKEALPKEEFPKEQVSPVRETTTQNSIEDSSEPEEKSAADFLLSLAGIFDSGTKDSSENVEAIVMDFVSEKHERK